jgi:hypothetical protein
MYPAEETYRNVKRPCAPHLGSTSPAPPAATERPRRCPRARCRGAARLSLGLDRRLRRGEGSASAVPWGDGFGKGDWAGWRGLAEASRPVMRAATGFHTDEHRRELRYKGHQVMPGQALAQDDLSRVIHPHRVKHALCDIDPEDVHLLLHWTRLLWLNGFTDLALIVAHCSRSAQGWVHFITTQ